jgi:hypothetical protein
MCERMCEVCERFEAGGGRVWSVVAERISEPAYWTDQFTQGLSTWLNLHYSLPNKSGSTGCLTNDNDIEYRNLVREVALCGIHPNALMCSC